MKNGWHYVISASIIAILSLLLFRECNKTSTEKEQISLVNALQDSLSRLVKKDSSQQVIIATLKTEQVKTFTDLNIKDQEVKELQEVVKEYKNKLKAGSSVSKATIETEFSAENPTIIYVIDTLRKDSLVYLWPTYGDSMENKWIKYKVRASRVRVRLDVKIKNDFSIVVGSYKGVPFADLTTQNPYSEAKSFRVYQVSMPKVKRWSIGPNLSISLTPDLKIRPTVGVGLQYNIIQF